MFRLKSIVPALLFLLFLSSSAYAQRGSRSQPSGAQIQVRVTYPNERPAPQQLRVDLLNSSGTVVMQTFTDDLGQADFRVTGSGNFRVKVSGMGIETAISEQMQIGDSDRFQQVYLQVHPTSDPESNASIDNGAMTSASQLKIPPGARKLFDKGVEALRQKDYRKAADLFAKATAAYPEYDAAYDNMGVAFVNLGQPDKARAAFQHAVKLNDKNADADRNYSRLLISDEQYATAKELLQKALMVEPQDPSSLSLLALAQLETGDYDGALQSALKVHKVSHEGYAVIHYVAGRAFESKNELENASTEYQMYLRESPDGPQANQARAALARITASAKATP
jgi:tetratricopeptide (TPR) repeat protein